MSTAPPSKVAKALNVTYGPGESENWLESRRALQVLVGILGMSLPLLIFLTVYIDSGYGKPLFSISHYYFTRASPIFATVVSLMAIFLLIYKGYGPADFFITTVAGLFALCLVIFPTDNISSHCQDPEYIYSLTILKTGKLRPVFHYISSTIFLSCLAGLSLFYFTRSDKSKADRGRQKRRRNRVYRICGVIMVLAMLVIFANPIHLISNEVFVKYHLMFWMETAAIESFGFAWLVKAEVFLRD